MRAQTCAPISPRQIQGGEQMKAIFDPKDRYGSAGWGSESARSFMGQRPESRTTPFRPSPRPNLLGGSDAPVDFTSSMRVAHTDPGLSPRTVRSVRSNDPSEADHPLLGLMDPHRKARLAGSFGSSYYQDAFLSPRREDYVPPRSKPPFADKAHEAFVFDRTPRHTSEQRSSFMWPMYISQAPVKRPMPDKALIR